MDPVEQLISEIESLPTLPDVALRLVRDLESRELSLAQLATEIQLDYALAARVLKFANAAVYGSGRAVGTVQAAVTRLGTRRTSEVVLTVSIIEALPASCLRLDLARFWSFSLGSGMLARQLAADLHCEEPDRAYLAGLLHSIGEALLAIYFPTRYAAACNRTASGALDLDESLAKEFGVPHPQVGTRLLQTWRLPVAISEAVEWHLQPESAPNHRLLSAIVFAADRLCRAAGLGPSLAGVEGRDWLAASPDLLEERFRQNGIEGLRAYLSEESTFVGEVSEFAREMFGGPTR